jgi:uncharacterized protein (TIGR04255 family)
MRFQRAELQHAPVQEVAVSIMFEPRMSYSLVPGKLEPLLKERLPELEENPRGLWGPSVSIGGPPLHRFTTPDKTRMVHIGHGMLAINSVDRYDFAGFQEFVGFVAMQFQKIGALGEMGSATLRYINFISKELLEGIENPLRASWTLPQTVPALDPTMYLAFTQFLGDETIGVHTSIEPNRAVDGDRIGLIVDLVTTDENPSNIHEWLKTAHHRVYQAFRNTIGDELHSRMQGQEP